MKKLTKDQIIERAEQNAKALTINLTFKQATELRWLAAKEGKRQWELSSIEPSFKPYAVNLFRIAKQLELALAKVVESDKPKRRSRSSK